MLSLEEPDLEAHSRPYPLGGTSIVKISSRDAPTNPIVEVRLVAPTIEGQGGNIGIMSTWEMWWTFGTTTDRTSLYSSIRPLAVSTISWAPRKYLSQGLKGCPVISTIPRSPVNGQSGLFPSTLMGRWYLQRMKQWKILLTFAICLILIFTPLLLKRL